MTSTASPTNTPTNAPTNAGDFSGLVTVITGGASGIGAAIADEIAGRGGLIAVLDLNIDNLPEGRFGVKADVSDDQSVQDAIAAVIAKFGQIDVLVNNAGIGAQGDVTMNSDDEWHRVFDVNVVGMVRLSRAAIPHLRKSANAAIVNTCSIAATAGLPQRALYSATKGAVLSLTRAMAADHLSEGIRVNCVNPGTADTPWVNNLLSKADDPAAERAALAARQPHGRLVQPQEVAGAVAYLASPQSKSTTGTFLAVDGGMEGLRLRK